MSQVQGIRATIFTLFAMFCSCFTISANAEEASLTSLVTSQLGLSSEQASGALGSLFSLAKDNMSGGDFSDLSDVVPDMSSLLKAAPEVESSSSGSLLGGLGNSLGGSLGDQVSKVTGNLDLLNSSFEALGIDAEMVTPLVTTVYDYVKSEGGQALLSSLKSSLDLPI